MDGYLLLAHDAPSWKEACEYALQALEAAQRLLGEDHLHKFKDMFWSAAITRPYMRAQFAIGYSLWKQEELNQASEYFQLILRMNPGDNQGARYSQVAVLMEMGKNVEALRLISEYSDDPLVHWGYNRALLHFRRKGDDPAGRDYLRRAFRKNEYLPFFLIENLPIPPREYQAVLPGELEEATEYLRIYQKSWQVTPGALAWLKKNRYTL